MHVCVLCSPSEQMRFQFQLHSIVLNSTKFATCFVNLIYDYAVVGGVLLSNLYRELVFEKLVLQSYRCTNEHSCMFCIAILV